MLDLHWILLYLNLLLQGCLFLQDDLVEAGASNIKKLISLNREITISYADINQYLLDHTDSKLADANMKVAESWLEESNDLKPKAKYLLEQFVQMNRFKGDDLCGSNSMEIFMKNDKETNNRSHDLRSMTDAKFSRVDYIIYQMARKRATDCLTVYPKLFKTKYQQLDPIQVERLETFFDLIISTHVFPNGFDKEQECKDLFNIAIVDINHVAGLRDSKLALEAITKLAKKDNKKVEKKSIKDLYRLYIIKTCKYYTDKMGTGMFDLAEYDTTWKKQYDDKSPEFYNGWARFKFCRNLLDNKENSKSIEKELSNLV